VQFAFIRVSHGLLTYDAQYTRNWAEARRVGVLRGTYQFFQPDQDPIAQADLLLTNMGTLAADDLPPVIDVEAMGGLTGPEVAASVQLWLDHVETATGRTPIIYSGYYFWRDQVGDPPGFARYPLWIPRYGPVCPLIPDSWPRWDFFQTSSTGSIAGISGNVDTDLWNGTLADLLAFANPGPVCGDGLCSAGETPTTCARDCVAPDAGGPPIVDGGTTTVDAGTTSADGGAATDDGGPWLRAGGRLDGGCSCRVAPGTWRAPETLALFAAGVATWFVARGRRRRRQ